MDDLTVSQVHDLVGAALRASAPGDLWITGEVSSFRRARGPNLYFDLVERPDPDRPPRASLKVAALNATAFALSSALERSGLELRDSLPLRIRGRLVTYAPSGTLQLQVTGVDAAWTLTQVAADTDALRRRLLAAGLLGRNRQTFLAEAPLRLVLVTSGESAAFHDFTNELEGSGVAWQVLVISVSVQGASAPVQIAQALAAAGRPRGVWVPDAVALVRGGGSRSDLMAFDSELVARAIIASPVPVLTGIGHEIDHSLADDVAYRAFKTPTAAAQALVQRVQRHHDVLERRLTAALGLVESSIAQLDSSLESLAERLTALASRRLDQVTSVLDSRFDRALYRADAALARTQAQVDAALPRALELSERTLAAQWEFLTAAERLTAAHDPQLVLARGFSVTRRGGVVVKDAAALDPGDLVVTSLASGTFASTVAPMAGDDA